MATTNLKIPRQSGIIEMEPITVTASPPPSDLKKFLGPDYETFIAYYKKLPPLKTLEAFREKYPSRPEVNNLLTHAYITKRKVHKANALITENYRLNPEHFLSLINYADLCLRQKKLDAIPTIVPKKKMHLTEFRAYVTHMTLYYFAKNEKEKSEAYLYLAHKLDPNSHSTDYLKNKLYPTKYRTIWKRRLKRLLFIRRRV